MRRKSKLNKIILISIITLILFQYPVLVKAEENNSSQNSIRYYMGTLINTGKDNGYSGNEDLDENDVHYGWKVGSFFVDGFTRVVNKENEIIFLKNVGDTVSLWFNLEQDISKLNGDKKLCISEDKNGYDKLFEVQKQNFGKGTLIIKHTDYQNKGKEPIVYTNYLESKAKKNEDTRVELFEEGDYEVALDYEIKNDPRNIYGLSVFPSYTNYRISFSFSVRNGNCMVYPFDTSTKEELRNNSFTENGFYLDLAKSRYLYIDIKKQVLNESGNDVVEDVRFNKPAKDGDSYNEEGIYIITVKNRYTDQVTEKRIYVGKNDLLRAYATTGLSIKEIKDKLDSGAEINPDGTIKMNNGKVIPLKENTSDISKEIDILEVTDENNDLEITTIKSHNNTSKYLLFGAILLLCIICIIFKSRFKKWYSLFLNKMGE